ncbi:tRNA1(Val) (adenine(37)-N6)-methyltransferase [Fundidesulfovibrio magnetotacticus]|uniref:tRNA1(Val) (Adenine(37)-N6)-methyltransferase n=1 Tax=Fundidesulfovibrio magnetotacticus TaxID=2730080 RepID=A0A6V8LQG3_9BACT|nr:methyltransferase [Fundidesulfovibrio magnetotacticus]GFK92369.1 tRNA1(Val) (adenine(37)-N6)-methyltransferase [Fundidesulfovibrio magnetotacticus]
MTPFPPSGAVLAARQGFPTGLVQPDGGYRFSLDPLLLAAFARPKRDARVADLGTGCGVAALALLLREGVHTPREALGLDVDPAMVRAAGENARLLGLEHVFRAEERDLRDIRRIHPPETFTLALANPPYREPGTGQDCLSPGRQDARFATRGNAGDFARAASWLLANRGAFCAVYPADRLADLMEACRDARLAPKRLRLVHSRLDEPARLALLEAVKNAGSGMVVEPPLELHEGRGEATRLCSAALAFCPALATRGEAARREDA